MLLSFWYQNSSDFQSLYLKKKKKRFSVSDPPVSRVEGGFQSCIDIIIKLGISSDSGDIDLW